MQSLLVCKSFHHGNTAQVAQAISEVLGSNIVTSAGARERELSRCQMVGFGSGIYAFRHHPAVLRAAGQMGLCDREVFIFSTYGIGFPSLYHRPLRARIHRNGGHVVGESSCRGYDTFGPLRFIGGINRGRPDENDLARARSFAERLAAGCVDLSISIRLAASLYP